LNNVQLKNPNTLYLLSARCSPELYDWLSDCNVMTFHTYAETEATLPELSGKRLIGGGTTSGLRAVTLGYLFGFARFVMYGFDSCLAPDLRKRYDSEAMQPWQIRDRWVRGRRFLCNAAMAMQADECQEYMKLFPDLSMDFKGDGLLPPSGPSASAWGCARDLLHSPRRRRDGELPLPRAIPARELGASINDYGADVLIFAKPMPGDEEIAKQANREGRTVIVDFCDDHFERTTGAALSPHGELADQVTCPTEYMKERRPLGRDASWWGALDRPHRRDPRPLRVRGEGTALQRRQVPVVRARLQLRQPRARAAAHLRPAHGRLEPAARAAVESRDDARAIREGGHRAPAGHALHQITQPRRRSHPSRLLRCRRTASVDQRLPRHLDRGHTGGHHMGLAEPVAGERVDPPSAEVRISKVFAQQHRPMR
jgi:hypothetical protein